MHNSIIVRLDDNGPVVYAIKVGVKPGLLSKLVNTWVSFILIFNNVRYYPISVLPFPWFLYNRSPATNRSNCLKILVRHSHFFHPNKLPYLIPYDPCWYVT